MVQYMERKWVLRLVNSVATVEGYANPIVFIQAMTVKKSPKSNVSSHIVGGGRPRGDIQPTTHYQMTLRAIITFYLLNVFWCCLWDV
ncbi:hypothetical protein BGX38DRAFT_1210784 [Terfezia claveryi]|nr:hypothetical protein BGX38DRAFT_1210784 [Terfezia claveryi]